jgi:hypothetical protein
MPMQDPNNSAVTVPTLDEIAAGCRKIQRRWSKVQEQGRRNWHLLKTAKGKLHPHVGGRDKPYEIPEMPGR